MMLEIHLEKDMLWRKLILGKFVKDLGVGALKRGESYGVGLWKSIKKGW